MINAMAQSHPAHLRPEDEGASPVCPDHRLLKALANNLRRKCGVAKADHLLLAVSGGADSVAMLTAMNQLAASRTWQLQLTVAHVHHHLRDHDGSADRDAAFVSDLAQRLGLRCVRADIEPARSPGPTNLEARSRSLRYAALHQLAQQAGCRFIVTAHHADDQLETMLMRLIRGTSTRGLAAMAWRRRLSRDDLLSPGHAMTCDFQHAPVAAGEDPHQGPDPGDDPQQPADPGDPGSADSSDAAPPADDVDLIRPLLDTGPAALRHWLESIRQTWCEDATNRDVTRWRARLRRDVLPVLRQLRPDASRQAAHAADHLRSVDRMLQQQAKNWLTNHAPEATRIGADQPGSSCRVDRQALVELHPALRHAVIAQLIRGSRQLRHDELERIGQAVTDHHTHRRKWQPGEVYVELTARELIVHTHEPITSRRDDWPDDPA